ncbi:uroporphyrinogen-III synthase [Dokdonella fugitiva]|jgi:uroporphyrinogen-III synthase|uniref:Uroporphyrinogen-III synthase n=1 Tax=Dokdonella fugitiva TaxID=328517 RepID=A0A4R2IK82_9GAMM|nr:uroporphyrinogen-III synthase [Dokdonella fugitiva]TCO43105.1 uroporphyrinogen-III synthase [Dokdonella fugitiva]
MPTPARLPRVDAGRALAGATVVVTRPDATALLRSARRLGACALSLPGLSLRALPVARPPGAIDAWIFTSPAAVRFALDRTPCLSVPARAVVFAVGAGTRAALARHGIDATAPERADSEGLLALPGLGDMHGRRLALVGAPGGRDLIAPTLRARGADVLPIHVYRRLPPRLTRRHFDALAVAKDPLVTLLSSGEALANLVAALPSPLLARLRARPIVVSSARLAAAARAAGFAEIATAASAAPRDLLATASRALADRRT